MPQIGHEEELSVWQMKSREMGIVAEMEQSFRKVARLSERAFFRRRM